MKKFMTLSLMLTASMVVTSQHNLHGMTNDDAPQDQQGQAIGAKHDRDSNEEPSRNVRQRTTSPTSQANLNQNNIPSLQSLALKKVIITPQTQLSKEPVDYNITEQINNLINVFLSPETLNLVKTFSQDENIDNIIPQSINNFINFSVPPQMHSLIKLFKQFNNSDIIKIILRESIEHEHAFFCPTFTLMHVLNEAHTGSITAIRISEDNKKIISGLDNGIIQIWDIETGNLIQTLQGHNSSITGLTRPVKNLIVSASSDTTAKVWNYETGELLLTFNQHTTPIQTIAKSSLDSVTIISISNDGIKHYWDIRTGELLEEAKNVTSYMRMFDILSKKPPLFKHMQVLFNWGCDVTIINKKDNDMHQILYNKRTNRHGAYTAQDVSTRGEYITIGTETGKIFIWKAFNKNLLKQLTDEQLFLVYKFSNDPYLRYHHDLSFYEKNLYDSLPIEIKEYIASSQKSIPYRSSTN